MFFVAGLLISEFNSLVFKSNLVSRVSDTWSVSLDAKSSNRGQCPSSPLSSAHHPWTIPEGKPKPGIAPRAKSRSVSDMAIRKPLVEDKRFKARNISCCSSIVASQITPRYNETFAEESEEISERSDTWSVPLDAKSTNCEQYPSSPLHSAHQPWTISEQKSKLRITPRTRSGSLSGMTIRKPLAEDKRLKSRKISCNSSILASQITPRYNETITEELEEICESNTDGDCNDQSTANSAVTDLEKSVFARDCQRNTCDDTNLSISVPLSCESWCKLNAVLVSDRNENTAQEDGSKHSEKFNLSRGSMSSQSSADRTNEIPLEAYCRSEGIPCSKASDPNQSSFDLRTGLSFEICCQSNFDNSRTENRCKCDDHLIPPSSPTPLQMGNSSVTNNNSVLYTDEKSETITSEQNNPRDLSLSKATYASSTFTLRSDSPVEECQSTKRFVDYCKADCLRNERQFSSFSSLTTWYPDSSKILFSDPKICKEFSENDTFHAPQPQIYTKNSNNDCVLSCDKQEEEKGACYRGMPKFDKISQETSEASISQSCAEQLCTDCDIQGSTDSNSLQIFPKSAEEVVVESLISSKENFVDEKQGNLMTRKHFKKDACPMQDTCDLRLLKLGKDSSNQRYLAYNGQGVERDGRNLNVLIFSQDDRDVFDFGSKCGTDVGMNSANQDFDKTKNITIYSKPDSKEESSFKTDEHFNASLKEDDYNGSELYHRSASFMSKSQGFPVRTRRMSRLSKSWPYNGSNVQEEDEHDQKVYPGFENPSDMLRYLDV